MEIMEAMEDPGGNPSSDKSVDQLTSSISSKGAVNQIIG
jgi:hypothetical protein